MDLAVWILRLVLTVVFLVSGIAKLGDRHGTQRAMQELGVPKRFTNVGSLLLPVAELAAASALLFAPLAGALGALALLLAFEVAIAYAMANHRAPECHCFGQLSSAPVGGRTFVRNLVLIAFATGIAVLGPDQGLHGWLTDRSAPQLVALALGLGVAAGVGWLGRDRWTRWRGEPATATSNGRSVGSPAPGFSLPDLEGREQTLAELCAEGRPVVLVFVHPGCTACERLLPALAEWRRTLAGVVTISVLSEGSAEANEELRLRSRIDHLLLQASREVYEAYEIRLGTPAALVIDPDGTIASPAVSGTQAVEELIRQTLHRPDRAAASDASS